MSHESEFGAWSPEPGVRSPESVPRQDHRNVIESRSRRAVLENAERKTAAPVCPPQNVRLGLVLSAGGLRGAGHLGVLRQLVEHEIPLDVIVGVSAGAIVAGYYAAAGFSIDSLVAD